MELSDLTPIVESCIHEAPAPCACACPFEMDIRSFMKKIGKGRIGAAYKDLRTASVFPTIAAELCDRPCLNHCQRKEIGDEPVDIGTLEKSVLALTAPQTPDVFGIPVKDIKIAVVGAGPCGLSLAVNMAQKKYQVTVFEKSDSLGGHLKEHEKYPVFLEDIKFQFSTETVDFQFGKEIKDLSELEGFDAVYIATGKGGNDFGLLESWDKKLFTTTKSTLFLGGDVAGMPLMEGIAAGRTISMLMEGAIQTGRAMGAKERAACHGHSIVPFDAVPAKRIVPESADGYTKAEAKEEASRCFMCECDKCMKTCEVLEKYKKPPVQTAVETAADLGAHFLASRTITRETYSCMECGYCTDICPENVDTGKIFHLSKADRLKQGIAPEAIHDYWLRELDFVSGEAFYAGAKNGKCEYAFFPGCNLSASLPAQTIDAAKWLFINYDAGVMLGCCGAGAYWAGDEEKFAANAAQINEAWENLGKPALVLACSSCKEMLKRCAPQIPTVSLYKLMEEKGVKADASFENAAVFDPCSARKDEKVKGYVRNLVSDACQIEELKDKGKCCGWGGHIQLANRPLYDTIAENRKNISDLPYIVYCANCREVFLDKGKDCRHILEEVFGMEDKKYFISDKKENRLMVKKAMMEMEEGIEFTPEVSKYEDMIICVPDAVRADMENEFISDEDVKECIAESLGENGRFVSEDGIFLASLVKRVITYWVEYKETENGYEIVNAYSHRMKFEEA